jgi:hypothetical protein
MYSKNFSSSFSRFFPTVIKFEIFAENEGKFI